MTITSTTAVGKFQNVDRRAIDDPEDDETLNKCYEELKDHTETMEQQEKSELRADLLSIGVLIISGLSKYRAVMDCWGKWSGPEHKRPRTMLSNILVRRMPEGINWIAKSREAMQLNSKQPASPWKPLLTSYTRSVRFLGIKPFCITPISRNRLLPEKQSTSIPDMSLKRTSQTSYFRLRYFSILFRNCYRR